MREWFGERLRRTNEAAWKAAHSRLYEHLRDTTQEGKTPTLQDLAPLYQAIAHGCRAGRYQEALDEIYIDRICRRRPRRRDRVLCRQQARRPRQRLSCDLLVFCRAYATPVGMLTPADRAWVLGEAAFALRGQGRFTEALPPERARLRMAEAAEDWHNAARAATNISEAELIVGDVAAAAATAETSVAHAARIGNEISDVVQHDPR